MQIEIDVPYLVTADRLKLFAHLQQLENWFRELVYVETKCRFGDAWWVECQSALKRARRKGIPAEKSLRADRKHRHMVTAEDDPLWFLSFDLLLAVLFDAKLWRLFEPYLTTKALVRAKFDELLPVRNRIAHARPLHAEDLPRVERILRDLDQGFWRFCTSYNASRGFVPERKDDPVYRFVADHDLNRHGRVRAFVEYAIRPNSRRRAGSRSVRGPGVFYDLNFRTRAPEYFDIPDLVKNSSGLHQGLLHMFLDLSQSAIRITIPSMLEEARTLDLIDAFYNVLSSHTTPFPRLPLPRAAGGDGNDGGYEQALAASVVFASKWPHYIAPGINPLAFLQPDEPCSFFQGVS